VRGIAVIIRAHDESEKSFTQFNGVVERAGSRAMNINEIKTKQEIIIVSAPEAFVTHSVLYVRTSFSITIHFSVVNHICIIQLREAIKQFAATIYHKVKCKSGRALTIIAWAFLFCMNYTAICAIESRS
jgi:hypothetical protein